MRTRAAHNNGAAARARGRVWCAVEAVGDPWESPDPPSGCAGKATDA